MLTPQGVRIKTDMRDAYMIAQCLSYGGYHAVYIPTEDDDSVKEYLRMRNDHKLALKKIKQHINAFCIRHGFCDDGTKWTLKHLKWLKKLEITNEHTERHSTNTWHHTKNRKPRLSDMITVIFVIHFSRGFSAEKSRLIKSSDFRASLSALVIPLGLRFGL